MTLVNERTAEVASNEPSTVSPGVSEPARVPFEGRRAWLAALGVAIFSWDYTVTRGAVPKVDDSWRYLLQQAASDGVAFGEATAFTYGPLVHLDGGPMFSLFGALASVLVAFALSWAMALLIIRRCVGIGLGRGWTLLFATIVTIVLVPPSRFSEVVALVAGAWLIAQVVDGRASATTQYWIAALSGIWFLVKPSAAVVMAMMALTASVAATFDPHQPLALTTDALLRAAKRASAVVAIVVGTMVGAWLLTGQKLGLLDNYLRGARELAGGYAEAMVINDWDSVREIGFVLIAAMIPGILGLMALRRRDARTVFAFLLVVIALVWSRQIAFGRPDIFHLKDGSTALALVGLATWPLLPRKVGAGIIVMATALTVVLLVPSPFFAGGTFSSVGPVESVHVVNRLINFDEVSELNRTFLADELAPEDHLLAQIEGRRTFFSPYLGVTAYALDADYWFPPAIQSYASFTEHLEDRSAEGLVAADGPELILHSKGPTVDDRQAEWESPRMIVTMFCSFDLVDDDPQHSLLERVSETCTASTIAEELPVINRRISVPEAAQNCSGLVTFRTFGAEANGLQQLGHLVRTPQPRYVTIDGESRRVIPGTMSQPHVIAAPAAETWIGADVPTPAFTPAEISFDEVLDNRGPLTVTFECWTTRPDPEAS